MNKLITIATWVALSGFTGCDRNASAQPALSQSTYDDCRAGCWWTLNDDMDEQCMLRCTFKARGVLWLP